MAGYTAQINQWNKFDAKWRKALYKDGLDYFHAKEMWRHPFTPKAIKIADDNLLFGFVAQLREDDYKKYYRNGDWGRTSPDSMYGLCFRYCLSFILHQACLERPKKDFVLNFVVEKGHKNQGAPAEIVAQLKRKRIDGVSEYLGAVSLGEKKQVPGLQAADGLAFGAWQDSAKNVPLVATPPDSTVQALRYRSMMKTPLFYCDIDERELKIFKNGYFAHAEHRRQFGQSKRQRDDQ